MQIVALVAIGSAYLQHDIAARDQEIQRKLLAPARLLKSHDLTPNWIDNFNLMRTTVGDELVEVDVGRSDGLILYSTNPAYRQSRDSWRHRRTSWIPSADWYFNGIDKPKIVRSTLGSNVFMETTVAIEGIGWPDSNYVYTKIDISASDRDQRKMLARFVAAGILCVAVTTLLVWASVELLLLRRVRATAHYFRTAAAERIGLSLPATPEDEISAIQTVVDGVFSYHESEKTRRSDVEASLESVQIREAKSIATAQTEIRQVRSLIEAIQSGVLTLDGAGWVLTCDDLAARRLGEQQEVVIHQPLRAFLRRDGSASQENVRSLVALNDWPPGTHRCRVVSPAGDGDAVEIVVSDAEAENGRRVVLIRDAVDETLRQEIGELAKAIEQTMGPPAHNLGSLRERLAVLREYVAGLESDKQLVSAALDRVPVALAVVDKLGNIRHLNHAARAIIGAKDGLSAVRGRLIAARREEQARLQQRLTGLLEDRAGKTADWAALQVEREAGTPWLVLLTPLREMAAPRTTATKPADLVIVMITDPLQPVRASVTVLQQLHGLTPAESEVLGRLTDGMRLSDIAEDLGVGIETVRTQLKSIFGKTGTSRQAELVRYVLLGGAWIHGTELAPALTDRTKGHPTQRLEDR